MPVPRRFSAVRPAAQNLHLTLLMSATPRILYCHCQYAQVLPKDAKEAVLEGLCASGLPFDAVADLCELSARKDPAMSKLAAGGPLKIVACYPRAVKWLFAATGSPLDPAKVQVCNLRVETATEVLESLSSHAWVPNLPAGKTTGETSPSRAES
jgi:hypothetical protein